MQKIKYYFVLSVLLSSTLLLNACGGELQDAGTTSTQSTAFSGVVIDGALARSTVYIDSNNNSARDPWEDYAFTDNDGYYSYNPLTKKNYCEVGTPDSERIFCLKSARTYTDVIIRIDGGYDLLTGEPFMGQMSRRLDMSEDSPTIDNVISPLTSLLTNLDGNSSRGQVLNSLRITEDDLDVNYLNSDGNGGINAKLLNTSLKIHKTVTILSDRLNDNYPALNDEIGVMNKPSSQVYKNLASELSENATNGLDFVLRDSQALTRVLDRSESVIRNLYEDRELTLPEDMGSVENPNKFSRVVQVTTSISDVVNQLINPVEINLNSAIGGARALEALIIKTVNETSQNDPSIDSAVNFLSNSQNSDLLLSLTNALSSNLADVTSLSSNDFSGDDFDSAEEIENAAVISSTARAFSGVAGKQMRVSDLDLGTKNALKDIEIEFYFTGETESIDGKFTACAKYIEDATAAGKLGDGNTRGELVKGYWSMLGATENNRESYSLLLTIEFLGTTYQAIMKTVGTTMVSELEYHQVRFDNNGEYRIWHSQEGLVGSELIPTKNSECAARLPSRVGI